MLQLGNSVIQIVRFCGIKLCTYVCQYFMNNLICFCTLMFSNQGGDTYMNPDIDSDMDSTAKQRMLDEYYGENRGTYTTISFILFTSDTHNCKP